MANTTVKRPANIQKGISESVIKRVVMPPNLRGRINVSVKSNGDIKFKQAK